MFRRHFGKFLLTLGALQALPAFAQIDLAGVWRPQFHEDQAERIPGPELGDYAGLPISDEARHWADAGGTRRARHAARAPMPGARGTLYFFFFFFFRGPLALRMWEKNAANRNRRSWIAIHQYIQNYEQSRTIWMDGRAASSRLRDSQLDGIFDREIRRPNADRLHHAHQAGMDSPQWIAGKRSSDADRAFYPASRCADRM